MRNISLLAAILLLLAGCAQYRQTAEVFADAAVKDVQAIDDDAAQVAAIAPQGITAGALARFPAGPARCALATLAGLSLSECGTAVTAAQVQAIVAAQLQPLFTATKGSVGSPAKP